MLFLFKKRQCRYCSRVLNIPLRSIMLLDGASTLSSVDEFDLREGQRACKTTCLAMKTPQECEFMCTLLQSFTVEAGEALQMFDTHGRWAFQELTRLIEANCSILDNIDTTRDAIYFSMPADFPKFRLAPRCLAPCLCRFARDRHCDKATLRSSATCCRRAASIILTLIPLIRASTCPLFPICQ